MATTHLQPEQWEEFNKLISLLKKDRTVEPITFVTNTHKLIVMKKIPQWARTEISEMRYHPSSEFDVLSNLMVKGHPQHTKGVRIFLPVAKRRRTTKSA